MSTRDDAVKAAAEAGQGVSHDFLVECGLTDNEADAAINAVAEAAVAAAAPILLAAERARIAAAIRRLGETPQIEGALVLPLHPLVLDYIEAAARIAETAPDVPMSPDKGHGETAPEEGP